MSESTREEIEARHRKELKALDGEKRAAVKKAKGTKGKKAKEEVAALELEFEHKRRALKEQHDNELKGLQTVDPHQQHDGTIESSDDSPKSKNNERASEGPELPNNDEEEKERQRRNEKARKKREKARENERERERRIAEEIANAGPAARDVENEIILKQLTPLNLCINEVAADGHCLYRAVAAHYSGSDYTEMRQKCAEIMAANEEEFSPFCELTDEVPDYQSYVNRVRSSADWGGHLELRALSMALKRPMVVYSAQSHEPLWIEEQGSSDSDDPIRLSFHRNYYALGEHYNQVVPVQVDGS